MSLTHTVSLVSPFLDYYSDIVRSRSCLVIKMRVLAEKAGLPNAGGGASSFGSPA